MKGMIFAAGVGSRLRPFTDSHPKALVPVGGKPMLRRVIEKMRASGINEIVVNVHHFADQIVDYLDANNNFGVDIRISDERGLLLDTGGGLLRARALLNGGESIAIHNADILTDFSLDEMCKQHNISGALATLLAFHRKSSRQLYFNGKDILQGWQNLGNGECKPNGFSPQTVGLKQLAFGGVHIVAPSIFPLLEEYAEKHGDVFSIIPFYLSILERAPICAFTPGGPFSWFDVGSPEKLAQAEKSSIICS